MSSKEGNFDECTIKLYLEIGHNGNTRKKGNSKSAQKPESVKLPLAFCSLLAFECGHHERKRGRGVLLPEAGGTPYFMTSLLLHPHLSGCSVEAQTSKTKRRERAPNPPRRPQARPRTLNCLALYDMISTRGRGMISRRLRALPRFCQQKPQIHRNANPQLSTRQRAICFLSKVTKGQRHVLGPRSGDTTGAALGQGLGLSSRASATGL